MRHVQWYIRKSYDQRQRKKKTEKYIYLSYELNKKSTHLNKEYEEISNSTEIVFIKNLQITKKRDAATRQMTHDQNQIMIKWQHNTMRWIFEPLSWEYDIVANLFTSDVFEVHWFRNQKHTIAMIHSLESKNDVVNFEISQLDA